jgi:hypothetical protein
MTNSKRVEPIREIASSSADALRRAMADAARRVADLERQLEQLESYRSEYMQGSQSAGASMDAVKLQNYRSFLDRLGDARRQHQKNLDAALLELGARCGARSASRRNPSGAWWSGSAMRSGRPRIGMSSARGTMRRCGYRLRAESGAETVETEAEATAVELRGPHSLRATAMRCALAPTIDGSSSISESMRKRMPRCAASPNAERPGGLSDVRDSRAPTAGMRRFRQHLRHRR